MVAQSQDDIIDSLLLPFPWLLFGPLGIDFIQSGKL